MMEVTASIDRQQMNITAHRALSREDFQCLVELIQREAGRLQSGWTAAVDLRGMWIDDPFLNEGLEKLQETILASGASKIGTLLDSDVVRMHLAQTGMKTQANQIARRFYHEQEWLDFLTSQN